MTTLMFRNTILETIAHNGQIWFTSAELAKALEYADPKAVSGLYNNNEDEFAPGMSQVVESTTSGNYRKKLIEAGVWFVKNREGKPRTTWYHFNHPLKFRTTNPIAEPDWGAMGNGKAT